MTRDIGGVSRGYKERVDFTGCVSHSKYSTDNFFLGIIIRRIIHRLVRIIHPLF